MISIESGSTYLVTGATGFLGEPLIGRILSKGGKIRALARNEGKLILLKQKYPEISIQSGDISDQFETTQALKGVAGVFHLAASKHVGLAETLSRECIKSNIIGSMNLLEGIRQKGQFIIGISTDKAAQVSGVYGASKFLMERLFAQYERLDSLSKYRLVRYGNVLYSTGSVLCKWKAQLQTGGKITITDPNATRFFWSVDQALDLIEECLARAASSAVYCPSMKSMKIGDLLEAMVNKYWKLPGRPQVEIIGLQTGENLHEKILEAGPSSLDVPRFSIQEIEQLI